MNIDRLKCDQCDKSYASKTSLYYHQSTKHDVQREKPIGGGGAKKKKMNCKYCKKSILVKNFERHREEVHGYTSFNTDRISRSMYGFTCDKCSFKAKRAYSLNQHKILKHSSQSGETITASIKPVCNICEKAFHNASNVRRHMKKEHSFDLYE